MKPSERFASLKQAAEAMDNCPDKADLLALFQLADHLHVRVHAFDKVVAAMKRSNILHGIKVRDHTKWIRRQVEILNVIFDQRRSEKILPLKGSRDKDEQGKSVG